MIKFLGENVNIRLSLKSNSLISRAILFGMKLEKSSVISLTFINMFTTRLKVGSVAQGFDFFCWHDLS